MIDTILAALSGLSVPACRAEGEPAALPCVAVSLVDDRAAGRCDGRDRLRRVTCQVDASAADPEEALALSQAAARVLTAPPYGYCRQVSYRRFDPVARVHTVSDRYAATLTLKEDF